MVRIGDLRGSAHGRAATHGVLGVQPKRRSVPPTLILQLNLDGTVLFANEMFELVFGWLHGELKGVYAVAVLRPNDVVRDSEPEHWQAYQDVKLGRRDSCSFDTHLEARDGHVVRLALTAKLIRHHNFVQIEFEVLSDEPVLRDHRAQFADPFARMAFGDFLEAERQRKIEELASKFSGLEQHVLELENGHVASNGSPAGGSDKPRGHKPSSPRLNTKAKFIAVLEDAIRNAHNVWHPTRAEVCTALGAKSENSLKDWLLFYELLRFDSVAKTLNAIAEELLLRGDRLPGLDASQDAQR
jgi:hypothetical protein